jgi:hypothetical protein
MSSSARQSEKAGDDHMNVAVRRDRITIIAVESSNYYLLDFLSVVLVIHYKKGMRHIILSSVACLAVPYIST